MKYLRIVSWLLIPIAFAAGFWLLDYMSPSFVSVRIIDDQKCSDPVYFLHFPEKTVRLSGKQINREPTGFVAETDTVVTVTARESESGLISYTAEATYKNCPQVVSGSRQVRSGWVLYETIRDDKFEHQVRSR